MNRVEGLENKVEEVEAGMGFRHVYDKVTHQNYSTQQIQSNY